MTIPGIGPIISSAVVAAIGNGTAFIRGRDFSAWLGLVPKQISTGDRTILGRITKRGNRYLRMLRLHHNVLATALGDISTVANPEIVEAHRMSGEVDYLLRVVVPDIAAYDAFYKKLIARVEISKVSSAFAMEQIKYTTALPLDFALRPRATDKGNGPRRAAS